jgi:hypothetical protein
MDEKSLPALKEYLEMNLKEGWIHDSTSPAGIPRHIVLKKDGRVRLCIDYCRLNGITIRDHILLPLISEALDGLANVKLYTKLAVKNTYHNLWIAEGNESKIAFCTNYNLNKYLLMLFALTNMPALFQSCINEILREYLDIFCIAYLDNILIYLDNLEQYHRHVCLILRRIDMVGLTLKPSSITSTLIGWNTLDMLSHLQDCR